MKRILVIDDNAVIRELLVETFEGAGYFVGVAENGMVGLRTVANQTFDLVISDLYMPEKEGIETIMDLRRDYPRMKIIAVSGAADQLKTARMLGADCVVEKPFDLPALLEKVGALLDA